MGLSKQEQEIIISKCADMDMFEAYCSDVRYIKKLDKIATAYKSDMVDGEVVAKYYRLTSKQLLLRLEPKKKELTEKQRQVLRDRLNKARNSQ